MVNSELPNDQSQAFERNESEKTSKIDTDEVINIDSEVAKLGNALSKSEFKKISIKIDEIENEVLIWRAKREKLNFQVIEQAKIRNIKNKEVKDLILNANDEKKKRNAKNYRITELKPQKLVLDEEIKKYKKILDSAEKKLENIEDQNSVKNAKNSHYLLKRYQKEIKNLEWKLQTKSFEIKEERMIVDKIAELDGKFEELAVFNNLGREKRKAYTFLRKNRKAIRIIIKEMNSLVKESRIHHKTMIESYSGANSKRKEADAIHYEIQKIKKEADTIHYEYVGKIKEKRKLVEKISKYKKSSRKEKDHVKEITKREKATKALERSKDGKKITFEEFKAS